MSMPTFRDRFTIFPDTGKTQLHCYDCDVTWDIGYHPSLDILNEQAREHNDRFHAGLAGTGPLGTPAPPPSMPYGRAVRM